MIAIVQRMAAGWSVVLIVVSGLLLLGENRGTPQFVITVFTLCMGLLLGLGAVAISVVARRLQLRPAHRSPSVTAGMPRRITPL